MTRKTCTRAGALVLAAAVAAACVPAYAGEPVGDGVAPTYDEAYYATLDYYGNLTEGSVVKSYLLNGADTLTDYGTYDEVVNLTDGTAPAVRPGKTVFTFGNDAPAHFYFEGKTAQPFQDLPWTLSVSYRLNGVPTQAQDLAGKTGEVEIAIDAVPNESAGAYARNNYTLEAMAIFNQDDILSLEAEGAQVQLIGNLRLVLFLALPGDEQHFLIRVGAEDFAFGGMTFLMVPATLSQLDQIAELSAQKEDLEDNYHKLSDSLDTLLDSLNGMSGSLYATAAGLDELNTARGTISGGKGQVYSDLDALRGDLDNVAAVLEPVSGQLDTASQALTDTKAVLKTLTDSVVSLRGELDDLEDLMDDLQDHGRDARRLLDDLSGMERDLQNLEKALEKGASSNLIPAVEAPFGDMTAAQVRAALAQAKAIHSAYENAGEPGDFQDFTEQAIIGSAYEAFLSAWENQQGGGDDETAGDEDTPTPPSLEEFLATPAGQKALKEAPAQAAQLDQLYSAWESDPDGFELLVEHYDTLNKLLSTFNETSGSVNSTLKALSKPTASLAGQLADLCGDLDELDDLLDDADDLAAIARTSAGKGQKILDAVKELDSTLDTYEPKAQESLQTVKDLSAAASQTVVDTGAFFGSLESLMQTSGKQLDAGTRKTLEGLAASLRAAARSLNTTGDVKNAKHNISEIVEDVWSDHTGDVDYLLNMDSTAAAVSLTSEENPPPQSVQVLLRTQEIKQEEAEEAAPEKAKADNGTFWSRMGQMFRDFWHAITGIFR